MICIFHELYTSNCEVNKKLFILCPLETIYANNYGKQVMQKLLLLILVIGFAGCESDSMSAEQMNQAAPTPSTSESGGGLDHTAMGYDLNNLPVVTVEEGQLRGTIDDGTLAFLGVPYATAERFRMPEPVAPWADVRDALVYGETCPIPQQTTVSWDEAVWPHLYWSENENCQFLNVWTQSLEEEAEKPVMVFLHGGGFTNGSSIEALAYNGANLSEFGDVVVVTLNHRINILGSLNLTAYGDEYENAGNTGMADIFAALEWIQENIETFGGDPDNVTLFGQSGGSGKIVHLMSMPSAEGLFHKAIAQSTGNASYLTAEQSARIAEIMLENHELSELETMPYYDLLEVGEAALSQVEEETGENLSWRPIVDEEYILSAYADWSSEMPFIAGTTFSERTSSFVIGDGRKNEWTDAEISENLAERYGDNAPAIAQEFQALFPDKGIQDAYFYDATYRESVYETLERRLSQSEGPVYNYLFAYEAPVMGGITPFHCAELMYVFHNLDIPQVNIATGGAPSGYKAQDTIAQAWVNFARTGNPSVGEHEWEEFSMEGRGTMVFDAESYFSGFDDRQIVEMITSSL